MSTEIVFLQHQYLRQVDKCCCEKLWNPLSQMQEEHFVNCIRAALLNHSLEALFRHFNNLLKCLVEFNFCQFVGAFDYGQRLLCPLLIKK